MKIRINSKDPTKAHLEKKLTESIFSDVYKNAFRNFVDIIGRNTDTAGNEAFYYDVGDINNIICFVGERGTGKSSCMISFVEAIKRYAMVGDVLQVYGTVAEKTDREAEAEPNLVVFDADVVGFAGEVK